MEVDLPPLTPKRLAALRLVLSATPERHREDAIQEAWVAYLEGRDAARAANRYQMNELRYERRHIPFSQLDEAEREELADRIDIPAPPDQPKMSA